MSDSYVSSRTGDLSPNTNGSALNGSSPSIPSNLPGITPIIRKKLMGYVGFANLPNQVHRKSVRKGFQFTVMVVGAPPSFLIVLLAASHSFLRRVGLGQVDLGQHPLQHNPLSPQGTPRSQC
jgi:hypothetical protein